MQAINASDARIDDKLADFKLQISGSQEEAVVKALKRSKSADQPYVYRKKGNEEQAKFNCQMEDCRSSWIQARGLISSGQTLPV